MRLQLIHFIFTSDTSILNYRKLHHFEDPNLQFLNNIVQIPNKISYCNRNFQYCNNTQLFMDFFLKLFYNLKQMHHVYLKYIMNQLNYNKYQHYHYQVLLFVHNTQLLIQINQNHIMNQPCQLMHSIHSDITLKFYQNIFKPLKDYHFQIKYSPQLIMIIYSSVLFICFF